LELTPPAGHEDKEVRIDMVAVRESEESIVVMIPGTT
jgi:hypothetical protein